MIAVEHLYFGYDKNMLLKDIHFRLLPGDFVGLTGANGVGKSTLIKLLLGELYPTSGTLQYFGTPVKEFKDWFKIGYVPQINLLAGNQFPATVEEIVTAQLYAQIGLFRLPKKAHKEKALSTLSLVGMAGYEKSQMGSLSGGQQQKVMLARALIHDPAILFLDEPTNGVDTESIQSIYRMLNTLNQEKNLTILMVTHETGSHILPVKKILNLVDGTLMEID